MNRFFRRACIAFLYLGSVVLAGCGKGGFTGCLVCQDGGSGGGPAPNAGQAQVTAVNPESIAAGSAPFTITVTGVNFKPTTAVMWNETALTTTYVSTTTMQAQVPVSLIGGAGTAEIVPSPVGTFNYGVSFTITGAQLSGNSAITISQVPVQANDMVWSPTSQLLYLAVASSDPARPDTLTSLDPQSGQFGASIGVGNNPDTLAISADGGYLYAGLRDASSIERFTLPGLQPDVMIPLGIDANADYYASNLQVQPTDSHAIAVARVASDSQYENQGDVAIYDDAKPRAQTASSGTNLPILDLAWNSNGQTLYGLYSLVVSPLYDITVNQTGAQLFGQSTAILDISGGITFNATTGYLYSDEGDVLDPASGTTVGTFPVNALQSGFGPNRLMIPESALNIAYFLGSTLDGSGPGSYVIEAFDLTHFNLLGAVSIPNVSGTPYKFVRWGSNGLAFLTTAPQGTQGAGGVYLVSGGFVTSPAP